MIGKKRYETICYMLFLKMPFCSQKLGYQIFLNNINNFFCLILSLLQLELMDILPLRV